MTSSGYEGTTRGGSSRASPPVLGSRHDESLVDRVEELGAVAVVGPLGAVHRVRRLVREHRQCRVVRLRLLDRLLAELRLLALPPEQRLRALTPERRLRRVEPGHPGGGRPAYDRPVAARFGGPARDAVRGGGGWAPVVLAAPALACVLRTRRTRGGQMPYLVENSDSLMVMGDTEGILGM